MDNTHHQIELIMVKIAMIASRRKRIIVYSILQKAYAVIKEILIVKLLLNNRPTLANTVLRMSIMITKQHC